MKIRLAALALLSVLPSIGASANAAAMPTWQADPAYVTQLGNAVRVDAYSIQPPSGYQIMTQADSSIGVTATGWVGKFRADHTRAAVDVFIFKAPASAIARIAPDQIFAKLFSRFVSQKTSLTVSPLQHGVINGMTYAFVTWKGIDKTSGIAFTGFCMGAVDGGTVIQIASQDPTADSQETLKLAEASAMTFKRR